MSNSYRVVVKGARADLTVDAVAERLAPLFKMTSDVVRDKLVSGSFRVKKGVDLATAETYRTFLEERGCVCAIEAEDAAPALAAPAQAARPAAPPNTLAAPVIKTPPSAKPAAQPNTMAAPVIKAPPAPAPSAKSAPQANALAAPAIKAPAPALDAAPQPVPAKPAAAVPVADTAAGQNQQPGYEPPKDAPSFAGRFNMRETLNRGAKKRQPLSGKGEIAFTALGLRIAAKRPRRFWFPAEEELLIPYADIVDAGVNAKTLRFSVEGLGPERRDVCFVVADADLAWDIKSLLPPRQSQEFLQFQNDERNFNESLEEVGAVPVVTYAVIVVNILVYLVLGKKGLGLLFPDPEALINYGANYGPATLNGEWWRLFTASFVHLGIVNLIFTTVALYKVGRLVEQLYGPLHFALLYVVAGTAGHMASTLWHIDAIGGGASGALFGVFGGLLAYMVNGSNGVPRTIMEEHRHSILVFVGYSLWRGFRRAGVDNAMHVGGLIAGMVMGYLLMRPLNEEARKESAVPKLATAAVAGAVMLGLASFPLFHQSESAKQELNFLAQVRPINDAEAKAEDDYAELEARVAQGQMTQMQMADPIEQKILPQWQAITTQLSAIKLSESSRLYQQEQDMLTHAAEQQRVLQQMAHAIRTNDMDALRAASEGEPDDAPSMGALQDSPDD